MSTWMLVTVPPRVSSAPAQRSSSPELPASWMTQMTLVTPASASCSPAPWPAMNSLWPTWVCAPNSCDWSSPELIVMTGMPSATAFSTASCTPSGLAIDTMSPSAPEATAESMSWLCCTGSPSPW